jgi:REP element-mobilizing transposase RayT
MKWKSTKKMKYHPHGSVLFCTFSVEQGLLLLANPLSQALIKSCLARACELYPVRICHIIVEATHVHLVLVVINPDDVQEFFRHFKAESAHMINGLLGRNKRTLWCEGYDSPIVLTPVRALIAIAYLYSNPAKDNLEVSIDRYPGFSSWRMFQSGRLTRVWKRLRRPQFTVIPRDANNLRGYTKLAEELLAASEEVQTFTLEPNAWMEAFGYYSAEEQKRLNMRLVARIRLLEERAEKKRFQDKKRVLGRERLVAQVFDTSYRPERTGRRMWCLAEKRSLRVEFITFFRALMQKARAVRERWRLGDFTVAYPPGLYPPSMPKLANVLGR